MGGRIKFEIFAYLYINRPKLVHFQIQGLFAAFRLEIETRVSFFSFQLYPNLNFLMLKVMINKLLK